MQRVWMALLMVLTVAVLAGVGYVAIHKDPVADAGETPGYTAPLPSSVAPSTDAASTATTSTASIRAVFIGDDYTLGTGATAKAERWTSRVASALHLQSTVLGRDGAGYAKPSAHGGTYAALVPKAVAAAPDLVVVSGGRNDVLDDTGTLDDAAKSFFADLHRGLPHATLVAIAPFWGDSPHPDGLSAVDTAVRTGVTAAGGTYLDVSDPLGGHPSWMADDAHPNDKGYRAIARAVTASLAAHLPG